MQELKLLDDLLDVHLPWKVMHVSLSKDEQRLDIHLGYEGVVKKNFFGFTRKTKDSGQTCPHCRGTLPKFDENDTTPVHHLQTAGFETWLHIPSKGATQSLDPHCVCNKQWRKPGTNCSPVLFEKAEKLLQTIGSKTHVQIILGLDDDEMARIIELTDFQEPTISNNEEKNLTSPAGDTGIPSFNHPCWLQLVKNELQFETSMVALSMLLRRIQSGYETNPTLDSGISGVKTLRQFFSRNEKLLQNEIETLRGCSSEKETAKKEVTLPEKNGTDMPSPSSPVWQRIVEGSLTVHTTNFALQMLISRALMNVKNNPGPASIEMGVRTIHNFFVTNKKNLEHELAQLKDTQ